MNLLSLKFLIFSPILISAIFLLPIFTGKSVLTRRLAILFSGMHFFYTVLFLIFFNNSLIYNFPSEITIAGQSWLSSLGISLSFGVDGISMTLVFLTSFLVFISCMASKGCIKSKFSLFYALIFILETSVLGVFCARDMFEFFLFWELELIPMYFLISLWGSGEAKKSAMKFLLYTFIGSLFMLCGLLMIYNFNFISTSELTADMGRINFDYQTSPIYLQIFAAILVFIGFAVKLPIVPLHTWLPDAHTNAPTPVSMILAGILLKMGAYGIIRFNIQILQDTFYILVPYLLILAFISIVHSAFVAYNQSDIKRIVAYSSISYMGLVLIGLCSLTVMGTTGAVFLMFAHGIVSAGLFYCVGIIYNRTGTREISQLSGFANNMPKLASFACVLVLAGIGLPLLISFPGEFMLFFGTFISIILNSYLIQIITIMSIVILILSAAYSFKLLHGVFFGESFERWRDVKDIISHEFIILFIFTGTACLFGVMPMTLTDYILPAVKHVLVALGG